MKQFDEDLLNGILSLNEDENYSTVILEITAGVGGKESMLFATELFHMYMNYADFKGWRATDYEHETLDVGGIRHASVVLSGPGVFQSLKLEAGVHRVQRIPVTEKAGRVHTSTAVVAVIPRPDDFGTNKYIIFS